MPTDSVVGQGMSMVHQNHDQGVIDARNHIENLLPTDSLDTIHDRRPNNESLMVHPRQTESSESATTISSALNQLSTNGNNNNTLRTIIESEPIFEDVHNVLERSIDVDNAIPSQEDSDEELKNWARR
jgi:hypothetical protein